MVNREDFLNAKPFPHVVIDDFWDPGRLDAIAQEFPAGDDKRWITYPDPKEFGKRAGARNMWGPGTKAWFAQMRSSGTCAWLEDLTGIQPLTADDIGGGMHMTGEGGRLESHVDFNIHPENLGLERRLNLLLFMNRQWEKEWGGVLYLGANREVEIIPSWNRMVIFETSEVSWHGHPDPIVGDHWRKSLAVYFYAPVRETAASAHTTLWQDEL